MAFLAGSASGVIYKTRQTVIMILLVMTSSGGVLYCFEVHVLSGLSEDLEALHHRFPTNQTIDCCEASFGALSTYLLYAGVLL